MDQARARELLAGERARRERLLAAGSGEPTDDLGGERDLGDEVDDADRRDAEETSRAVDELLRERWAALRRAEARLAAGDYGRSVRSGSGVDQAWGSPPPGAAVGHSWATGASAYGCSQGWSKRKTLKASPYRNGWVAACHSAIR
jgi:hypothetical protein